MHKKLKIILLAGPTASGKSQVAISLAKSLNGEIINADSMQIYKEFRILTSRPGKQDEKKIKHHLYGIISVKKKFSTGNWLTLATKEIKKILRKKKIPIVVGGTGLYFNSLLHGLATIPNIPLKIRSDIRKYHKKIGQLKFYNKLLKLDPLVKNFISSNDSQRSLRAYEVKKYTKKSLYKWFENTQSNFDKNLFKKFFINIDRNKLLDRINNRTEKMFKQGIKKEVSSFLKLKIKKELSANKIIGINEIINLFDKKNSLEEMKEKIKIRTRQYAKRQNTWARGKMTSWDKINYDNHKEILKKVLN
jgi:tRNA dimethylallyltransferase